ncbi:ArsR/SmtB family transcription factor [Stygiolobus caldivivus]|uniref:HTH arsR-type domain-containing protein n=1 Tax=Stygiolobus caldivivus TaxID=2824673 RepID=A0A8D5U480_9CREN|nr:winged helix-turn-helix domain-containing protein [Stygiolobus caldivivus]BCU68952.1 hypothetical protein KN1_02490 [Stygiolobus caldivivus]
MESQNGDIFDAISHEIRRRIIQLVAERPRTFSELQRELELESAALAFHIKKLNGLIMKDEQGYYKLTQLGMKAYNVIQQIHSEEVRDSLPPRTQGSNDNETKKASLPFFSKLFDWLKDIDIITDLPMNFSINVSGVNLKKVYDGPLSFLPNLEVSVDGGKVEIDQGDPHAEIRCIDENGFKIQTINNELKIDLDGCSAIISYPPLSSFKGRVDGGAIIINNSVSDLSLTVDGGAIHAEVNNVVNSRIEVDGGAVQSKLEYVKEGTLYVGVDGGAGKIHIDMPREVGIIFCTDVNGGVIKGCKNIPKERNIKATISVNGGAVRVTTGQKR